MSERHAMTSVLAQLAAEGSPTRSTGPIRERRHVRQCSAAAIARVMEMTGAELRAHVKAYGLLNERVPFDALIEAVAERMEMDESQARGAGKENAE